MKASIVTVRQVWDDSDGVYLNVGPTQENSGWVAIYSSGLENEEYFGKLNLPMPRDFAEQLAHALLAAVQDAEREITKEDQE